MKRGLIGPALLALLFALITPLYAIETIPGGPGGPEDPPDPNSGGQSGQNWNPVVTCSVVPGQGILAMLTCLQVKIENPPPQCPQTPPEGSGGGGPIVFDDDPPPCYVYPFGIDDFNVNILQPPYHPYYGIRILKDTGAELDRYSFWEDDTGIATVLVTISRTDMAAFVGLVTQEPAMDGIVELKINSHTIVVQTSQFPTSVQINSKLINSLTLYGYQVDVVKGTLRIRGVGGIHSVQFRATDTAITRSSIKYEIDTWSTPPILE
ncbi:MAG: hypothetical protein ACREAA_16500 [Candidatus Polarisedimenticolia bacterium]